MFRRRDLFTAAVVAALFAGPIGQVTEAAAQSSIAIQVNSTMKPGGSEEAAIKKFREVLEDEAPGRFEVVRFMSGQLGGENAVLELLNIGETQMSLTGGNWRSQYAPEYDPISIPFLFPTGEAVDAYLATDSGQELVRLAEERGGIVHLGAQMRAPRHMTTNKPVEEPADLDGFRLRLPSIPVWIDIWSALGAQPVVVPAPEIYLAMQTGQVDGHENSLVSPYSRKLYEVQSHLVMTGHVHFPWHWVASKTWWDTLSEDDQDLIQRAVDIARAEGNRVEAEKDSFYLEELKKRGMEVIRPDRGQFQTAAQPAIEEATAALAEGVLDDVDTAISASE